MKKIFLLLWCTFPVAVFAQHQFLVVGKIKNIQFPAKVYLDYRRAGERSHWDSTTVKNGKFEFKGTIADTVLADIYVNNEGISLDDIWGKNNTDSKRIYLVSGTTYVTGNDSACNAQLSGTKINADYWKYTSLVKSTSSDSVRAIMDRQFIKQNPGSYISFDQALNDLDKIGISVDEMTPMFYSLTADVRSGNKAVLFKNYLNSLKASAVGSMAPEFSMPDSTGKLISLSSFRGKYVLVDFWASWCGPCRQDNPNLVKQFEKYKTSKFTILGVSLDRPGGKDVWLKAIKSDGLSWSEVTDLNGFDNKAALLYGIKSIPQNVLIDPSGKIIAKNLSGDDLDKKLAEVLK